MMNREWETEADSQSFVKELSVVTKSFSKKVDEMLQRNEIADAKRLLDNWK